MGKNDLDLLQGSWSITSLEMDGQAVPVDALGEARIAIKGDRFTSTGMGAVYEGTVQLDGARKPGRIDMQFDAGPEKGNTNLGIYEIKGDEWKLCIATRGERPMKFESPPGSGVALEVLVRGDSVLAAKTRSTKKAAADAPSTAPAGAFEGEWRMVSAVMNGAPMDPSMVSWVKRIFQGDHTTVIAGPQTMLKAVFTLDASQSPKAMDYQNIAGSHKGKSQLGIYDFDGKVLRICMSAPGDARPPEFESKRGDARALTIWTR